jgi:hypothetical protein
MESTIITSDIYLVAALLSKGYEIQLPVNTNDSRHFKFTVLGENLDEVKREWVGGELHGNLVEFSRCLRNMKLLIHEKGDGY